MIADVLFHPFPAAVIVVDPNSIVVSEGIVAENAVFSKVSKGTAMKMMLPSLLLCLVYSYA